MKQSWKISFRSKLLVLFFAFSFLPLTIVAVIVISTVQNKYTETLATFFNRNVELQEKILLYYLESNKTWIKSIAAQDILLSEMEKYALGETIQESKIFASLVSLRRENSFIEKIYIVDQDDIIVTSSTSDDKGQTSNSITNSLKHTEIRAPHYEKIFIGENGNRAMSLVTPFIRRSDGQIIGQLVVEFNTSVIKSLLEGNLYTSQSILNTPNSSGGETYVIDEDGYPLTNLAKAITIPITTTVPFTNCKTGVDKQTAFWNNYANTEVYGTFKCNVIDDLRFTFVVEQSKKEAFSVSNNLGYTIFGITLGIGVLLVISILKMSQSITRPIKALKIGTEEYSKGNFNYQLNIQTRDEIEELANSFNDMAGHLKSGISDLQTRDLQLNKINKELEKEKETISAERNKLEVIISGVTDAVIAVNFHRQITTFNKAAEGITGLSANQVLGKSISTIFTLFEDNQELIAADYCPTRTDDFEGVIYNKKNLRLLSSNGKEAYVNLITEKIKEGANVDLGCILAFHDITKERQLEDMKLDFVSMAAHELRTPITSIRGYASVLEEELSEAQAPQAQDWKALLGRISISAEQLLALVENLLNVTKIEKGILSLSSKNENWSQCINEVTEQFRERAASKNITVTIKEIDPKLTAYVDKLRINEVISNLVSNAINYTQLGGTITIEVKESADRSWIETSVGDNGHGIPKDAQKHLFEKFFRVSGPLEQGSKGNGLGLYISKSIVQMHGGKIWVDSEINKGAKFTFTVPKAA